MRYSSTGRLLAYLTIVFAIMLALFVGHVGKVMVFVEVVVKAFLDSLSFSYAYRAKGALLPGNAVDGKPSTMRSSHR